MSQIKPISHNRAQLRYLKKQVATHSDEKTGFIADLIGKNFGYFLSDEHTEAFSDTEYNSDFEQVSWDVFNVKHDKKVVEAQGNKNYFDLPSIRCNLL